MFSPPQSFFLNFSCFSFVKFFLIVGDFDAASWESHGTSFTIAGLCSGCRWFV